MCPGEFLFAPCSTQHATLLRVGRCGTDFVSCENRQCKSRRATGLAAQHGCVQHDLAKLTDAETQQNARKCAPLLAARRSRSCQV